MYQFAVEDSITRVLSAAGVSPERDIFEHKAKSLLRFSDPDDYDRDLKKLKVLATIRNSLHANGFHKRDDITIKIEDVTYRFSRNERPKCCTWSHVLYATYHSLLTISKMYRSEKIKSLKILENEPDEQPADS